MPDEEVIQDNAQDYIAEIQKLKESTVSKEQYQKLLEDNKRLIQSLASGEKGEAEGASAGATLEELRKKLSNPEDMTNLEYITAALELREKVMETGGDDPFLPNGTHARATTQTGKLPREWRQWCRNAWMRQTGTTAYSQLSSWRGHMIRSSEGKEV